MKFLKVFVLALFFLYLMPLGAFCHDSHNSATHTTEDGHCVLMCHITCAHAIVASNNYRLAVHSPKVEITPSFDVLSYQNPFLDSFKRPPIVTS